MNERTIHNMKYFSLSTSTVSKSGKQERMAVFSSSRRHRLSNQIKHTNTQKTQAHEHTKTQAHIHTKTQAHRHKIRVKTI